MKRVHIIRGNDGHTLRLVNSMKMCGASVVISETEDIDTSRFDVTLVDPSIDFDPMSKINSDIVCSYDAEDDPHDYKISEAYESYHDKIDFYCKMDWVGTEWRDKKLVGFPNPKMLSLVPVSLMDGPQFDMDRVFPFFVGMNTFLGNYKPKDDFKYVKRQKLTSLGYYEPQDELVYSQRIDWILSLKDHRIPSQTGLVFNEATPSLSLEWQSECFGEDLKHLQVPGMPMEEMLRWLLSAKIGLCPTGHHRNSWRRFDIMSTGAILINTDTTGYNNLYPPASEIVIKDSESLGEIYDSIKPNLESLHQEARLNREIFQKLTPDIIWNDFIGQFK
jgi:hypothetical protein